MPRSLGGPEAGTETSRRLAGTRSLVEAAVWASDGGRGPDTVVWAVIALPLLAVWVPAGTLCAAPPRARRRLLVPLAVGVVTAAVLGYAPATGAVAAEIRGHTVGYAVGLPTPHCLSRAIWRPPGSLLLSGDRWLVGLGGLVTAGAAGCWALWRLEFVSTWCAVAAVCSVVLYGWVRERSAVAGTRTGREALRG
ncbi:DUF6629 family protein [Streptomyces sp. NPDC006334]|uniref:DUF6629 family protein n=1 Tax=Streptomyces sp. NPDC006334 TaxID=3156754 RepID=UPI0033ACF107